MGRLSLRGSLRFKVLFAWKLTTCHQHADSDPEAHTRRNEFDEVRPMKRLGARVTYAVQERHCSENKQEQAHEYSSLIHQHPLPKAIHRIAIDQFCRCHKVKLILLPKFWCRRGDSNPHTLASTWT